MRSRLLAILFVIVLPLAVTRAQADGEEYIVVLKDDHAIAAVNKRHDTQTISKIASVPIYLLKADGKADTLKKLREDTWIEHAEENRRVRLVSGDEPPVDIPTAQQTASSLDPYTLTTFYGTTVLQAYVDQPAVQITQVNEARTLSTGAATRVGYIDTGVDFSHPALSPWLDPGIDVLFGQTASEEEASSPLTQQMASLLDDRFTFILNQAMASLLDGDNPSGTLPSALGHGTLVAGIIHLFAPESRIVPIKAFDAYGNTTIFTIVDALYRAKELDVDVLNMSFSISNASDILHKAIIDVSASGVVMVASSGNDSREMTDIYPAAYPQVISVAATDFADRLASFSNYGKSVSVAAPGAYVVSTVPGGKYAAAWGTSFSAPIVSGTIALIASGRGRGQSDSMMAIVTADSIDDLNPGLEKKLGKGRINVQRALKVKP